MTEQWYRVEDRRYASVDEFEQVHTHTEIHVLKYTVIKHTKTGVWVDTGFWDVYQAFTPSFGERPKRFCKRDAKKRFACPTLKEAYESFIARKERQASILEARARSARSLIGRVAFDMQRVKDD